MALGEICLNLASHRQKPFAGQRENFFDCCLLRRRIKRRLICVCRRARNKNSSQMIALLSSAVVKYCSGRGRNDGMQEETRRVPAASHIGPGSTNNNIKICFTSLAFIRQQCCQSEIPLSSLVLFLCGSGRRIKAEKGAAHRRTRRIKCDTRDAKKGRKVPKSANLM